MYKIYNDFIQPLRLAYTIKDQPKNVNDPIWDLLQQYPKVKKITQVPIQIINSDGTYENKIWKINSDLFDKIIHVTNTEYTKSKLIEKENWFTKIVNWFKKFFKKNTNNLFFPLSKQEIIISFKNGKYIVTKK